MEETQNALIEVFKTYLKRENTYFQPHVPDAGRSNDVIPLPRHGLILADDGPDPEQVVELLEVCVVVISYISQPCC